ncbi:MAG: FG-GAP repeat domain-containing protein, partial [Salinibacter sp.]
MMTRISSLVCCLGGLLLLGSGCLSGLEEPTYEWTVTETHRWTALPSPRGGGAGFRRLDSTTTGVGFVNTLRKDPVARNQHLLNGSGVAVGDVTGDGWPDLYLARLEGPNALYRNRGAEAGGIRFEKVPGAGGAALPGEYSTGTVLADVTGEGRLDLLVTTLGGPNVVYENTGGGQFRRMEESGLHAGRGSTTMALADING